MNYTAILKRAWQITWRHRALWLFGVLLAIFSGSGGGSGGGGGSQAGSGVQYVLDGSDLSRLHIQPEIGAAMVVFIILAIVAFVLLMVVLGIVVANTARGALIGMVDEVERTETTSVGSGFRMGWARFLRLFAIELVIGIPVAVAIMALLLLFVAPPVVLIVIAAAESIEWLIVVAVIGVILLFLLWLLITIAVGVAAELLGEFAYRRCVLAQEGVLESVRQGYWTLRRNLRDIGLTWLILLGINLAYGIVLAPVAILALALAVVPGLAAWALAGSIVAGLVAAVPLLLIVFAALLLVGGIYTVFKSTVWTLVYREIVARGQGGAPADDGGETPDDGAPADGEELDLLALDVPLAPDEADLSAEPAEGDALADSPPAEPAEPSAPEGDVAAGPEGDAPQSDPER